MSQNKFYFRFLLMESTLKNVSKNVFDKGTKRKINTCNTQTINYTKNMLKETISNITHKSIVYQFRNIFVILLLLAVFAADFEN